MVPKVNVIINGVGYEAYYYPNHPGEWAIPNHCRIVKGERCSCTQVWTRKDGSCPCMLGKPTEIVEITK